MAIGEGREEMLVALVLEGGMLEFPRIGQRFKEQIETLLVAGFLA